MRTLIPILLTFFAICVLMGRADVTIFQTAQFTGDRISPLPALQWRPDFPSENTLQVDRSARFQSFLGFGGAFTESSAFVLSTLSEEKQQEILDLYFTKQGLGYVMGRVPIGACDYALESYNFDNVTGDFLLESFSVSHDKQLIIPFIQKASKMISVYSPSGLRLIATPWSAPGWMKTGNEMICSGGCGNCTLRDDSRVSWALYFSKYLTAYANFGIKPWAVTVQNEPEYCPAGYEGMHWTPETERDFIRDYLGPQMLHDHPDVNILIYDHNKDHIVEWATTILSDPEAAKFVYGTACHWYSGDSFDHLNTTHNLFPDKVIIASEATVERELDPQNPLWAHGEHYAHDIIGDINNWVTAWIDWNLMLDMNGAPDHSGPNHCEGPVMCGADAMILVDAAREAFYPQIFYYYMAQFSKFIPPGSIRIALSNDSPVLEAVAMLSPSGEVVVVAMNPSDSPISAKLFDQEVGSAAALFFPPHSIQTLIY